MTAASEPSGPMIGGSDSDTASAVVDDPVMHFDRSTRFRCDEDETRTVREDGLLGLACAVGVRHSFKLLIDDHQVIITVRGRSRHDD